MISLYKFLVAVGVSTCATGALLLIIALMTDHWAKADFKDEERHFATDMHWGLWSYCISGLSPDADTRSSEVTVKPKTSDDATSSRKGDRHDGYGSCDKFNLPEVPGIMHLVQALLLTATLLLAFVAYGAVSGRLFHQRKNPGPREEILCVIIACLGFVAKPTYTSSYRSYEFEYHAFSKIKTPEQDWSLDVLISGSGLLLGGTVFTAVILRLGQDRFNRNKAEQRRRARLQQLENERALLSFSPTELPEPSPAALSASTTPSTSLSTLTRPTTSTTSPSTPIRPTTSTTSPPTPIRPTTSTTSLSTSTRPTTSSMPTFSSRLTLPTSSTPTLPAASQGSRQPSHLEPTAPPTSASTAPWDSSGNSHHDASALIDDPPSYDELPPRKEEEELPPPPSYEQVLSSICDLRH